MASATFTISCTTTTTPISASNSHHLHRPSKFSLNPNPPKHRRSKLSCAASSSKDQTPTPGKNISPDTTIDRRNVLLGLGGLYGAYNLSLSGGRALANPVLAPDIKTCGVATVTGTDVPVPYSCCPPSSDTIVDYKLPEFSTLNVRPAAHDVDAEYLEKYKTAVQKMKDLPYDDPRSWYQQANVHCAYCNMAYKLADGVTSYQVHNSWLFFPFHRWYLYFHERILQSLINDPTFTLPYWNWDNPKGMYIPEIFDDPSSSLYDPDKRDTINTKEYVVDLSYGKDSSDPDHKNDLRTVRNNLAIMYRQMMGTRSPSLFFGHALRAAGYDNNESGGGSIESGAHTAMHLWVGNRDQDHHEDMGNFYSAANDPLFYCHHGNVDRMWSIWKTLPGKRRRDCSDPDYLQSEFLFYDENKNLVKVKVQDCLDETKLGYTFQPMPTLWEKCRPPPKKKAVLKSTKKSFPPASKILPTTLAHTITFTVMRPTLVRSKEDKEDKDEILKLGITYDPTKYINFDVFLNEDNECKATELDRAEYVGSFSNLAHIHTDPDKSMKISYDSAITELLEDLGLESERCISVTLVPKCDGEFVTINSAKITMQTEC